MHDRLFAAQDEWAEEPMPRKTFARYAAELDIAPAAFATCVAEDRVATVLLQDVIFAASSRVNGTPAFLVNNRQMVMGLKSFAESADILEKELKKAR